MEALVLLLAVLGAAALVYRSLGGIFRLAVRASQETAASGLAELSATRGDVTAMVERKRAAEHARRDRRVHTLLTGVWVVWLVAPLLIGNPRIPFAIASLLWLLPTAGRRRGSSS